MQTARVIDREIAQYLPRLSDQQKQAVLGVVKSFAADQQDWWDEIGKEQGSEHLQDRYDLKPIYAEIKKTTH